MTGAAMSSGPIALGEGYSIEIELHDCGVPGVMQFEVIWSPKMPPQRVMDRLIGNAAYVKGLTAFANEIDRRRDAERK